MAGALRARARHIAVLAVILGAAAWIGTARAAGGGAVVLGSSAYAGSNGVGWGTPHPSEIFNGGDPSGRVTQIRWSGWGGAATVGHGLNAIFMPQGGYYGKLAGIELIAYDLGRCTRGGPLAYRELIARVPKKPGGPYGAWFLWSGSRSLCRFGF
jgi:hypothetical protein